MTDLVKSVLLLAVSRLARWCIQNWELSLLRLLPPAAATCAILDVAQHRFVLVSWFALGLDATFFVLVRQFPSVHEQAKETLEEVGRAVLGIWRFIGRMLLC